MLNSVSQVLQGYPWQYAPLGVKCECMFEGWQNIVLYHG